MLGEGWRARWILGIRAIDKYEGVPGIHSEPATTASRSPPNTVSRCAWWGRGSRNIADPWTEQRHSYEEGDGA